MVLPGHVTETLEPGLEDEVLQIRNKDLHNVVALKLLALGNLPTVFRKILDAEERQILFAGEAHPGNTGQKPVSPGCGR